MCLKHIYYQNTWQKQHKRSGDINGVKVLYKSKSTESYKSITLRYHQDLTAESGKQPASREVYLLCYVWLIAHPQTVVYQAPLSIKCSRQEYCSGLPFPSPGDLLDPGIEPRSPILQAKMLYHLSHQGISHIYMNDTYNVYILENMNFCLTKKFMTFWFHLFDLEWIECYIPN